MSRRAWKMGIRQHFFIASMLHYNVSFSKIQIINSLMGTSNTILLEFLQVLNSGRK